MNDDRHKHGRPIELAGVIEGVIAWALVIGIVLAIEALAGRRIRELHV